MRTYIVTGTDGFIGKRVADHLERFNHTIIRITQEVGWDMELENNVKSCDGIFHIGAISDTTLQDANIMLYYNFTLSKRLFDLARKYDKRVVYSSSAANYGNGDGVPNNIYGWSKLLAEEYGLQACKKFVALRYFNVYGPGEEHKGKMASVAYQAWNEEHLGNFKLFPGEPKRDFVYIDDVVDANIHAMENWVHGVFEVGSGKAETFESLVGGMEIEYEYHDKDKIPGWYQFFTEADERKFMPNWKPKYNVQKGTKKYRDWLDK